jgi:hypothetical protein
MGGGGACLRCGAAHSRYERMPACGERAEHHPQRPALVCRRLLLLRHACRAVAAAGAGGRAACPAGASRRRPCAADLGALQPQQRSGLAQQVHRWRLQACKQTQRQVRLTWTALDPGMASVSSVVPHLYMSGAALLQGHFCSYALDLRSSQTPSLQPFSSPVTASSTSCGFPHQANNSEDVLLSGNHLSWARHNRWEFDQMRNAPGGRGRPPGRDMLLAQHSPTMLALEVCNTPGTASQRSIVCGPGSAGRASAHGCTRLAGLSRSVNKPRLGQMPPPASTGDGCPLEASCIFFTG